MATCLLQSEKDKLVAAIRSGDLNMERLYHMPEGEARAVFEKIVGIDSAKLINAEFEKARITATKKAAADYFSVKDKPAAAKMGTQAEFSKNLLSDNQKQARTLKAFDDRIQKVKVLQTKNAEKIRLATDAEQKANLQFKQQKYQGAIDRLTVRREDAAHPVSDRLVNKINSIQDLLGDGHYSDLASIKLGQDITPAQGDYIAKAATEVRDLARVAQESPMDVSATANYLNASHSLGKYLESLKPVAVLDAWKSVMSNLLSTGKNFILTSLSTPIKATENQIVNATIEAVMRRVGTTLTNGVADGVNPELESQYLKYARGVSIKTGYNFNVASMEDSADTGKLGEKNNFTVSESAKGHDPITRTAELASRKLNQATTFIAIDLEHNLTFTEFYQRTMASSLNLYSTSLAKSEGLRGADLKSRAAEVFKDAMLVEPKTDAGMLTRTRAQAEAARVTSTNPTVLGNMLLGIKNKMNQAVPGLGDVMGVIVKVPSTVISNAIMSAGPGLGFGAYDVVKGLDLMKSDTVENHYKGLAQVTKGISTLGRTVGVLTAAALWTSTLTKKDFRTDNYGNQFVMIGGRWVNREYFNAVAPAVGGMMDVKQNYKAGQSGVTTAGQYVAGTAQSLKSLPILNEANKFVTDITNTGGKGMSAYFMGLLASRDTPNLYRELTSRRPGNELLFGASGVETPSDVKADDVAAAKKAAATKAAKKQP